MFSLCKPSGESNRKRDTNTVFNPLGKHLKTFWKAKCSREFSQRSKIYGECHVFLVLTMNINVKKTWDKHRVYPLGKTSENILENKVFTGVFPAKQSWQKMPCLPCVNYKQIQLENLRLTPRSLRRENVKKTVLNTASWLTVFRVMENIW